MIANSGDICELVWMRRGRGRRSSRAVAGGIRPHDRSAKGALSPSPLASNPATPDLVPPRRVGASVKLASTTTPGTFGPTLTSPIEVGSSWVVTGGGSDPVGVGGYDLGDLDGDGNLDIANIGSFGSMSYGTFVRTAALFVKPGRGDGTFGPIRVWRVYPEQLASGTFAAEGFSLQSTRSPKRADVVFFPVATGESTFLDVLVHQ